jgi:hypothetical protein
VALVTPFVPTYNVGTPRSSVIQEEKPYLKKSIPNRVICHLKKLGEPRIWRRERDSNRESASPYPFEMSIDFSNVGTTDIQYLACTLWLRDASSKVVFSEVSRVLGR